MLDFLVYNVFLNGFDIKIINNIPKSELNVIPKIAAEEEIEYIISSSVIVILKKLYILLKMIVCSVEEVI